MKREEDPVYRKWVRENYPCAVLGKSVDGEPHACEGIREFAHVRGKSLWGGDRGNGLTLCTKAHRGVWWSLHRVGRRVFERRFGIDLAAIAQAILHDHDFV